MCPRIKLDTYRQKECASHPKKPPPPEKISAPGWLIFYAPAAARAQPRYKNTKHQKTHNERCESKTMFDFSQIDRLCKITSYYPKTVRATVHRELGIKIIKIKITAKPSTGITHQDLTCDNDKILYTHVIAKRVKDCHSADDICSVISQPFINTATREEGCVYEIAYRCNSTT